VKAAYKDSRDKIQSFVTSLKKDGKTEDTELKKMNDDLIAEGERLVKDIDKRIEKLDKVSDEDMKKGQNDFIINLMIRIYILILAQSNQKILFSIK
ncbi:hypothetical protein SIK45_17935, partial [Clostridioides difficile]|nr:hypothetical protein [Clostridioides difficile]